MYVNLTDNVHLKYFKHCPHLKQLYINCPELTEQVFTDNIQSLMPELQSLCIQTWKRFSDSFINSFHSMKNIEKVRIRTHNGNQNKYYTKYWYFGKSLSEVMLSPNGVNVIRVNDNCGLISTVE